MWYQSESARSMPPARVPRVGTIHPATTTATAPAASQTASRDDPGAGNGPDSSGERRAAITCTAAAIATDPTIIVKASKAAKVPSASARRISAASPSTASATRAGAPLQPGSSVPRSRQAAKASGATISISASTPRR